MQCWLKYDYLVDNNRVALRDYHWLCRLFSFFDGLVYGKVGDRKDQMLLVLCFASPQTNGGFRCFASVSMSFSSSFFFCFLRSHHKQPPFLSAGFYNNVKVRNPRGRGKERKKGETNKQPSDTRDQGNDNESTSGFLLLFSPVRVLLFLSV